MKILLSLITIVIISTADSFQFPNLDDSQSFNLRQNCSLREFRCQNGQCIAKELLCDGKKNCMDGSDETRTACLKPEIFCPDQAFRCAYGACIDGDLTCNGVDDCVDQSDEQLAKCDSTSRNTSTVSNCKSNEHRCENGQCIKGSSLCDGSLECSDRSDETVKACENVLCESPAFRCSYGGCIDGNLKCDGKRDCADGSDENVFACSSTTTRPKTSTSTSTSRPIWTDKPAKPPCTAPKQPQNGRWKLHKSQCKNDNHCDANPGANLEPGSYLVYSCNSGYKLNGNSDVFCGPEGKWSNEPVCSEIRCKSLNSESTIADCTYENEWTSCEPSAAPGTIAKIRCRSSSYRPDVTVLGLQRDTVRCNKRGKWEPDPIRCVPVCGEISTKLTPLIVNGRPANIPEFPWHATLYRVDESSENAKKEFICGSTIIQNNLIVTAAHCIFDESTGKIESADLYYVATGNLFQDYDNPNHNPQFVHKRKVKNIYAKCDYLGYNGNYASDIAILHIEKPFVFTPSLLPICLDISSNDQLALEVGKIGKVAGFGRTELAASSAILQAIDVPVVSLSECRAVSTTEGARKYITDDKLCAGYRNGSSVCDGDSGGGLVFNSQGLWYLRGIVSVGIGSKTTGGIRTCNSELYSLYTKISRHIAWIQDIILKLETNKIIPLCQSP